MQTDYATKAEKAMAAWKKAYWTKQAATEGYFQAPTEPERQAYEKIWHRADKQAKASLQLYDEFVLLMEG